MVMGKKELDNSNKTHQHSATEGAHTLKVTCDYLPALLLCSHCQFNLPGSVFNLPTFPVCMMSQVRWSPVGMMQSSQDQFSRDE